MLVTGEEHKLQTQELLVFILLRYNAELIYSKSLERLSSTIIPTIEKRYSYLICSPTLGEAFEVLKKDCKVKAEASNKYCKEINENLLTKLNNHIEDYNTRIEMFDEATNSNIEKYNNARNKCESLKEICKNTISELDASIMTFSSSTDTSNFLHKTKRNFHITSIKC